MKNYSKTDLLKIFFVWGAIFIGLLGAIFRLNSLIIICIIMLAITIIYVRYYTMKERLAKKEKPPLDKN